MRSLISKGAKSRFEARRAAMYHLPSLSSLEKTIVSMEQEEIKQKVMTGEATPMVRSALGSRLYPLEKTENVIIMKRNDISAITAPNHATLEEVKEVEDRGVDVATKEA
jgi:hypothetical protein